MSTITMQRSLAAALAMAGLALVVSGTAQALTLPNMNLVDLLRHADPILVGTVTSVTDGIGERGLPYTEVTLSIEETLRGTQSGTFTFRQIGLQTPRLTADGTKLMLPAPEGIPRYAAGEHLLLFVGEAASMTGLRSTVGLGYGKFRVGGGQAINDLGNAGVFQNISLATGLATANDSRILTTSLGAVNPEDLLTLVRRALQNNWVSTCQMWKTNEGANCVPGPRPPRTLGQPKSRQAPSLVRLGVK